MVNGNELMTCVPVDVLPLVNALDVLVQRHPPDRLEVALIAEKLLAIDILLLWTLPHTRIVA